MPRSQPRAHRLIPFVPRPRPPPPSRSLVGGGSGVSTALASGMPMQAYVAEGATALYSFTVMYPSNVSIVVTSLSGDPELFVSAVNPFPSLLNNTWASATTNVDERVWIPQSDPNYPPGIPFTLYIGVNGYNGNSTFVITATMMNSSATPVTLLDGVPQAGRAPAHDFAYYQFSLSSAQGGQQGLDVVATPRDGDVDMCVAAGWRHAPRMAWGGAWWPTCKSQ